MKLITSIKLALPVLCLIFSAMQLEAAPVPGDGDEFEITMTCYPNPVRPGAPLFLDFRGAPVERIALRVYDMRGRSMENVFNIENNRIVLHTDRLKSGGVYTLFVVLPSGQRFTEKVIAM